MAQAWNLETARILIKDWASEREHRLDDRASIVGSIDGLESYIIDQQPASLEEAERLLDLIVIVQKNQAFDLNQLCRLGGGVRNDIGRLDSRCEHSFAPQASGPIAGRA